MISNKQDYKKALLRVRSLSLKYFMANGQIAREEKDELIQVIGELEWYEEMCLGKGNCDD